MLVSEIKQLINQNLAGEMLSWKQMMVNVNWAIDEINSELNAKFPTVTADTEEYTAIPDKYIRQVVIPGAVHNFYVIDDEGMTQEQNFYQMFAQGMFRMLRDYSHLIPEEYQDDMENGSVDSQYEDSKGLRGIEGDITTVGWW